MPLSLRAKNLLLGGSLAAFAASVFTYTVVQMNKVRAALGAVYYGAQRCLLPLSCRTTLTTWTRSSR